MHNPRLIIIWKECWVLIMYEKLYVHVIHHSFILGVCSHGFSAVSPKLESIAFYLIFILYLLWYRSVLSCCHFTCLCIIIIVYCVSFRNYKIDLCTTMETIKLKVEEDYRISAFVLLIRYPFKWMFFHWNLWELSLTHALLFC